MEKRNRIIYWIATLWLALGMMATGIVQVLQVEEEAQSMQRLGYPDYVMTILGVWKIIGVIVLLIPKFTLVKEWAYAGFFFVVTGAIASHLAVGGRTSELFGPVLLLLLIVVSWYFRPAGRRIILKNTEHENK